MRLRTAAVVAAVVLVLGVLENSLFGKDNPGTAHDVSIAFFLLAVVALIALVGIGVAGLVRRQRA
jgi:hypothetical protein